MKNIFRFLEIMLKKERWYMKSEESKVTIIPSENDFGIFAVNGNAVENQEITQDNVDDWIKKMTPILALVQKILAKDRSIIVIDNEDGTSE